MVAESGNRRLVEVDRQGEVQHEIPLEVEQPNWHKDTRLVRRTAADTYLVAHESDGAVREYERDGNVEIHAFERLENGLTTSRASGCSG